MSYTRSTPVRHSWDFLKVPSDQPSRRAFYLPAFAIIPSKGPTEYRNLRKYPLKKEHVIRGSKYPMAQEDNQTGRNIFDEFHQCSIEGIRLWKIFSGKGSMSTMVDEAGEISSDGGEFVVVSDSE
ncbi:hypothetical protein U1Q18_044365 [Sarracenia purpurea var. burkii]